MAGTRFAAGLAVDVGVVVKVTSAMGAAKRDDAARLARQVQLCGTNGGNKIIDGFIIRACRDGSRVTAYVIDMPAHILWMARNSFDGYVSWRFAALATVGNRDLYIPGSDNSVTPVAVDATNAKLLAPHSRQFIAPDHGTTNVGTGKAYVHGLPEVRDGWIYGVTHTRVASDALAPSTLDDFVITVVGAKWSADVRACGPNGALVIPPAVGAEPEPLPSRRCRVLCVPARSVAAGAGKPNVVIRQLPNDVFLASLQVRETPVYEAPALVGVYVAVAGRDLAGAELADEPVVVVGRVTLTDTEEQSLDWAAAPSVASGYSGQNVLNVLESVGLFVGSEVSVCTVAHFAGANYFQTMIHRLDAASGAVLGSATFTLYPELSQPVCASRDALWVASASTAANVSTSCHLHRIVDGAVSIVDMSGWMPMSTLLPGISLSSGLWTYGAMAPVITEIGEGRAIIVACAAGAYGPGSAIQWHLLEIEVTTLTLVGVRGAFGVMSLTDLVNSNPRPLSVSVVTPQILDAAGDVLTPAVLLKNVFASTSVSTDGGMTWREVATNARGYPYYFGNQAHSFISGESL